jgi:SAM-dependent methyltransferase
MIDNKLFWDNQAKEQGSSVGAVNFDIWMNELENITLNRLVGGSKKVLDLGCGNGDTLCFLAENHPATLFTGIDFSGEMIDVAKKMKRDKGLDNAVFFTGDALDMMPSFESEYDIVIGKRLLINMKPDEWSIAIRNIRGYCKPNGLYMMCECFLEPLASINLVRDSIGLSEIKVHEFNNYLSISNLGGLMGGSFHLDRCVDFGSLYYFVSRVFNAGLTREGNPCYTSPLNGLAFDVACKFNVMGGLCPERLYIWRRKGN